MYHGTPLTDDDRAPDAQAANLLGPSGPGSFDPVSAMLQLTGIAVAPVAVPTPTA